MLSKVLAETVLFLVGKAARSEKAELVVVNGFVCAWQRAGAQRVCVELMDLCLPYDTIQWAVTPAQVWLGNFLFPQYVVATSWSS